MPSGSNIRKERSGVIVAFCLASVGVLGQSLPAPEFEVADIRPVPIGELRGGDIRQKVRDAVATEDAKIALQWGEQIQSSGSLRLVRVTMRTLITLAYKEIVNDQYLRGGPNWLDSDLFDLIAKLPPNVPSDQERLMIQGLLAERFHLVVHREEVVMPVYGLVTGNHGAKLDGPTSSGKSGCAKVPVFQIGASRVICQNVTIERFLGPLSILVGEPVLDLSGIEGTHDFQLDWDSGTKLEQAPRVIGALEKLGFKLERRKQRMPIVVVDSLDRIPTEH